jgi:nitroreductase/dihydropteridine reductase
LAIYTEPCFAIALVAAAEQEVDSTPMEGFDPDAVDTILGLKERGLRSVVLMPLGYRDTIVTEVN